VLTKLVVVSLWRLVRGLGLTAAVAYGGVWVAGSESWLVGSPPAGMRGIPPLVWLVLETLAGHHSFIAWGCGDYMTSSNRVPNSS
jgi:hypothetical protein